MAGKGVRVGGVDGPQPAAGNQPQDPESHNTVPQASRVGTWVEETDIRPTMLYLLRLKDDYESDGHVISQALASTPRSLSSTDALAAAYDQIESSVGRFATDTLIADTKALASGSSSSDAAYTREQRELRVLSSSRDLLATRIKKELSDAAQGQEPNRLEVVAELVLVQTLLHSADAFAAS